jgi:hypothetical protein
MREFSDVGGVAIPDLHAKACHPFLIEKSYLEKKLF